MKTAIPYADYVELAGLLALARRRQRRLKDIERTLAWLLQVPSAEGEEYYSLVSDAVLYDDPLDPDFDAGALLRALKIPRVARSTRLQVTGLLALARRQRRELDHLAAEVAGRLSPHRPWTFDEDDLVALALHEQLELDSLLDRLELYHKGDRHFGKCRSPELEGSR